MLLCDLHYTNLFRRTGIQGTVNCTTKLKWVGRWGCNINPLFVNQLNMWIWLWDYKELELIDPFHQLLHKVHWEYHVKISLKIFYIFWYLDTNICFTRINKSKKKRVGTDASLTDTAYLQQHRASINQLKYETRKVGTRESTPHEKYYMIWNVAIPQIPDYLKAKCKSRWRRTTKLTIE